MSAPEPMPEREQPEPKPVVPGHFVSSEHESDTARFLEQVQDLVRRRKGATTPAPADEPG